jgi:hypothetical protein
MGMMEKEQEIKIDQEQFFKMSREEILKLEKEEIFEIMFAIIQQQAAKIAELEAR